MYASNIPPQPEPSRASGCSAAGPRLLPAASLSPIEQNLLRYSFGDLMTDALKQGREHELGWLYNRWWMTLGTRPRLTHAEAARLSAELALVAMHAQGDERRVLLRRSKHLRARARR